MTSHVSGFFAVFSSFVLITASHGAAAAAQDAKSAKAPLEPFTFDDIFNPSYRASSFSGRWISNDEFLYFKAATSSVMRFNVTSLSETVFVSNTTFIALNTGTYYISPDLQYVLFAYQRTSQWRHSFFAKYAVLNIASSQLTYIPAGPLQNKTLQYAGWSSSGHALSFAYENDLYYILNPSDVPERVTVSGANSPLYIFNGIPDWLYEEDVLSDRVAHYWSPNDQYICYASFNDTEVPLQPWPWYGSKSNVYVRTIQIAYPKAGNVTGNTPGPNTKVQLHIFDVLKKVSKPLSPPSNFSDIDHYYLQVVWRNDSTVMVTWANRVQNISIISVYDADATNPQSVTNLQLTVSGGWVEVPPAMPLFVESGQKYLTILPQQLTSGPWRHLALVTAPDTGNGAVTYLMNKEEEVMEIVGYDPIKNYVYFTSTNGEPTELHIMRVNVSGGPAQIPYCLTCEMPSECRYMTASFSPSGIYYFLNCHGPDIPTYTLRKTGDGSIVKVMENNDALRAALALKALPTREFLTFPVGDGYTGRAEIFFPPNYNSSQKYKLLVYAYAGPGSQRVMKTFPVGGSTTNWLLYLKSTHNIIVASLDGRGSMAAGDKLKFEMYRKLSTVEVQDQIIGGNYFRGLPYIDKSVPSAIFGWSYGGGVAAHVMGDPSRTFTCGISVAPVTTKAYYDTAYTERYLGLATKNDDELGYNNTDVMNKVANFHNKTFMIAQGSADDNVHYMHSAHLITALANAGVQFRQNMYADQNHNINSPGLSRHLYASMTNFLLNDCWPTQTTSNNPPSVTTGAGTGRPNNLLIIVLSLCLALLSVVKRNIAN